MSETTSLYESRRKVYPKAVGGTFRSLKWLIMLVTLGIYYLTPWIRWDRGPGLPDQAVLVDLPNRRFFFFFIELWPQEVYYFTGLLVLGALVVFMLNAMYGRVWCGYTCPQTVWTDLFLWVERWVEGDRNKRMRQDNNRWRANVWRKKLTKYAIFLLISVLTGGAWVFYFADAPSLLVALIHFEAPLNAWIWIGVFTGTTFLLGGVAREQVCIYMCPWPRIQAAMTDEDALSVTYRYERGEPRAPLKRADMLEKPLEFHDGQVKLSHRENAGDCIDCKACVAVCPVGIDIRNGLQLECIHCALCIDACDEMMKKVDLPTGLIGYDTEKQIQARVVGKPIKTPVIRPRTMMYAGLILLISVIMGVSYFNRAQLDITVQRDRNPLFVTLSNGDIRNGYELKISNRTGYQHHYQISLQGDAVDAGVSANDMAMRINAIGYEVKDNKIIVPLAPSKLVAVRLFITQTKDQVQDTRPVFFKAEPTDKTADAIFVQDFFKGPLE
ncbi:MAG: cytochrome c oxidase accessory protein CcoG [Alphaproteobacteria bacterium]